MVSCHLCHIGLGHGREAGSRGRGKPRQDGRAPLLPLSLRDGAQQQRRTAEEGTEPAWSVQGTPIRTWTQKIWFLGQPNYLTVIPGEQVI